MKRDHLCCKITSHLDQSLQTFQVSLISSQPEISMTFSTQRRFQMPLEVTQSFTGVGVLPITAHRGINPAQYERQRE